MVMYEKQPILDKFKTVLNFSRHISYCIKTLFRGLLSSSDWEWADMRMEKWESWVHQEN